MSGYDFYDNTVINSTQAVLIGGGRRNLVHHNRFIFNDNQVQ